jgi:hypothetical protein
MPRHDGTAENDGRSAEAGGQDSGTAELKEGASTAAPPAVAAVNESILGNLTMETLNRYLAAAAEDRDAAEARSSQVIARFTKLTIAVMGLTMVIAGANVAMIIRQSSAVQPVVVVPPRPVEMPTVLVPPAQAVLPTPVPSEPREPLRPAEKIPLLGPPPSTRVRQASRPGPSRLARTASPRPQTLLSATSVEIDSRESSVAERW